MKKYTVMSNQTRKNWVSIFLTANISRKKTKIAKKNRDIL